MAAPGIHGRYQGGPDTVQAANFMNNNLHAPVMRTAFFRFYAELNDFLPVKRRKEGKFSGALSLFKGYFGIPAVFEFHYHPQKKYPGDQHGSEI